MNRKIKTIMFSFAILGMGFLATAAMSENSINHAMNETASVAAMEFKSTEINLGDIPQGIPKDISFEFTNTGTVPLIITDTKASCGCTNVQFPDRPITAGETAHITAVYNAKKTGSFTKKVTVFSNASVASQILSFTGVVK